MLTKPSSRQCRGLILLCMWIRRTEKQLHTLAQESGSVQYIERLYPILLKQANTEAPTVIHAILKRIVTCTAWLERHAEISRRATCSTKCAPIHRSTAIMHAVGTAFYSGYECIWTSTSIISSLTNLRLPLSQRFRYSSHLSRNTCKPSKKPFGKRSFR